MKLSIIVPLFNEEKTIAKILIRVLNVNLQKKIKKEIIVVDDGSTDNSRLKIKNLKSIKKIFHKKNMGKGAAIRSGLAKATGDLVIIQDADLEYDPSYMSLLIEPIINGNAKVVFGTRLLNYPLKFWGKNKTVLPTHLFANKLLTFLTNLLFGSHLTDMETGYKLFKTEVLKKILINSNRFNFEPEITAKVLKLNIPIVEVPINTKPRTYKEGKKIGFLDGLIAILTLIKYRLVD